MIAQFPDHKALIFAYEELLRIGVPEERISAYFEELDHGTRHATEHQAFLKQLYAWRIDNDGPSAETARTDQFPPLQEVFQEHGGTLDIKCPQLGASIVETVLRHNGVLVG